MLKCNFNYPNFIGRTEMAIDRLLALLGDNDSLLAVLIVCMVWIAWHLSAFIERRKSKEDDLRRLKESWGQGYPYLRGRLDFLVERVDEQNKRLDACD